MARSCGCRLCDPFRTAAGTGRGATNAFQTGPFLFSSRAIFAASLLFFGTTWTKPLWMNSVSMPFFANFFGSGSGGSVAATSTLALIAGEGRPKWERMVSMSYFASTLFRVSACAGGGSGSRKPGTAVCDGALIPKLDQLHSREYREPRRRHSRTPLSYHALGG